MEAWKDLLGDLGNLAGLQALRPFDYLEFDFVSLDEGFEAAPFDSAVMHEYIVAVILLDKTESLGFIKPFNLTFQFKSSKK